MAKHNIEKNISLTEFVKQYKVAFPKTKESPEEILLLARSALDSGR